MSELTIGDVVKMLDDYYSKDTHFLVGHVNTDEGVCNCCYMGKYELVGNIFTDPDLLKLVTR